MPDDSAATGHPARRGTYAIPGYVAWLWADCLTAEPAAERAHPSMSYLVGIRGGASIQEIMDILETSADAGVQFGEVEIRFDQPLAPNVAYDVAGEVVGVERKHGRRAGPFDLATIVHDLRDSSSGAPVATVTHKWVVPRADAEVV